MYEVMLYKVPATSHSTHTSHCAETVSTVLQMDGVLVKKVVPVEGTCVFMETYKGLLRL